jgi:O-antigen ligase
MIALPWLNPIAGGPSPSVTQLVFAWACLSGFLIIGEWPTSGNIARGWLFAGVVSSIFGLVQYTSGAAVFSPWINQTEVGQAFGNLRQRNQFATLTAIALAAAIWRIRCAQRRSSSPHLRWEFAAIVVLAMGSAASSSRTGFLQLILLCLLSLVWGTWRQSPVRWALALALVTYTTTALVLPLAVGLSPLGHGVFARLANEELACASRITLWRNVLHLVAERPWFGWGWGELDFAHYVTSYPGQRFCDILDNAHNLPLQIAVEAGVPAAVLVIALIVRVVWAQKPWRELSADKQLGWTVVLLIGIHSLLEYPLWYGPFQIAAVLSLTLIRPCKWRMERSRIASGAVGFVLLGICIYIAWDYWRISQIYLSPGDRAAVYRENTIEKIRTSWVFQSQVRFAEFTTTTLTPVNAAWTNQEANDLLHFSPEPRVIEKLIESAVLLGRDEQARLHMQRYRLAFPDAHAKWAAKLRIAH